MVTPENTVQYVAPNGYASTTTYFGLSTDSKPTENVGNGSAFIEMNTGKIFFFNAAGSAWIEWGA